MNKHRYILVPFFYLIISIIFLYPLILHFNSHVLGLKLDASLFIWDIWWVKKSLLELHTNPFYSNFIYYPFGTWLIFHTLNFCKSLLALPLQFFFSPVVTYNLLVLFSFVVSGTGMFVLARYLTKNSYAAFLSGLVYSFCPYIVGHLFAGHFNLISTEWIPFYIYFLIRLYDEGSVTHAVLCGLFLLLTAFSDYQYFIFLIIFTFVYLMYKLIAGRKMPGWLLSKMLLPALIFLVGFLPVLWGVFKIYSVEGLSNVDRCPDLYSTDLLSFITPNIFSPLWGRIGQLLSGSFVGCETGAFAGYVALAFSIYAVIGYFNKDKSVNFWFYSALIFAVLSLGPVLHINGQSKIFGLPFAIPLPYQIISCVPVLKEARTPARIIIMFMLSVSVLSAYGFNNIINCCMNRFKALMITLLISMLVLLEFWPASFTLDNAEIPEIYHQINKQAGDFAILELPVGLILTHSNNVSWQKKHQYYQSMHNKRLLGGLLSRLSSFTIDRFLAVPVLDKLASLNENVPVPVIKNQDKQLACKLIENINIKYILVHRDFFKEKSDDVEKYIAGLFPVKKTTHYDDNITCFETKQSMALRDDSINWMNKYFPGTYLMPVKGYCDIEQMDDFTFRWLTGPNTIFKVNILQRKNYLLKARLMPFPFETKEQSLKIRINGKQAVNWSLTPQWAEYEALVPASLLLTGTNTIEFTYKFSTVPDKIHDSRKLAVAAAYIKFE